ncbi:MAG: polysaccharide biosynthesis tyrosine autokinase [Opitutales bacterium]|nr:polysaccharide biosynthesis tyrosine autokinase [Opitutales bacterium]
MDENFDGNNQGPGIKPKGKIRGISDFLLIIRDRWLLAITLALPIALGYVYNELQVPEYYSSSATFRLIPPPSLLNLQKVERDNQVQTLITRHLDGINSQELRVNVVQKIAENPEYKSILLAPFLKDGIPIGVANTINFSVNISPPSAGNPRITITANSRSGRGAQIIADTVQTEYEKLHKSRKSEKVESARNLLELLLENRQSEEKRIAQSISSFKKSKNIPYLEDAKQSIFGRKSQYQSEITSSKLAQIKITTLLKQILNIRVNIGVQNDSLKSQDIESEIAIIKQFFEIDAIESYGNVPSLRKSLFDLEKKRRDFQELAPGYLERHPKMLDNARQVKDVKKALTKEVQSAIDDFRDKLVELQHQESEFTKAMESMQLQSANLMDVEEKLEDYSRELSIVRGSTDQIHKRLNDVKIEQSLPSEQDDPLHRENFASLASSPYTPDKMAIRKNGIILFFAVFLAIPILLEFIDNRVKSPWDVDVFIGKDLIGGIPQISQVEETKRPLIVGNDLDDGLTESFRSMYSRIQMNSNADYPKIILVTSAIPSEGKSLISANLAYSCANHGRKTILIDFDLRRPGLHKFCGIENNTGLVTLINEAKHGIDRLKDLTEKTLHPIHDNLFLLPSGGKTRAATEMLESNEFEMVINHVRTLAEVIIIDSPPIGLFPDSLAIARKVEEVLFVTRYGKVSRKIAKNLIENIEETGANVLGVVLNDLPQKKTPGYYYSGYYGYGYFRYKYYNKYYGSDSEKS